jgi:hypothetical protein
MSSTRLQAIEHPCTAARAPQIDIPRPILALAPPASGDEPRTSRARPELADTSGHLCSCGVWGLQSVPSAGGDSHATCGEGGGYSPDREG